MLRHWGLLLAAVRLMVPALRGLQAGCRDHGLGPHQDAGERPDGGESVEPLKCAGDHRVRNKASEGVAVKQPYPDSGDSSHRHIG